MELRRRNASQIAAMAEMADDNGDPVEAQPSPLPEDSDSDEEYGVKPSKPSKPRRKAPSRRGHTPVPRRPDLVELVIREMGRKDLFSKDTLKNLRRTSRGFKVLLDELFSSLSTVTIRSNKGFKELLKCRSTTRAMETFRYVGARPLEVSHATMLMVANPSHLKKLVLENAGLALDILVHATLPNLTSLKIASLSKASKALEWLCHSENVWPLQELELSTRKCNIELTVLVPALKRLRQLRKLALDGRIVSSTGSFDPEGFLEDSFPELETLELCIKDLGHLGLLNEARLPALRHFKLEFNYVYTAPERSLISPLDTPWLQQLHSLTFNSHLRRQVFSGEASILTAFRSGALKTLVIHCWHEDHALFESVHLPGLTSLEICVIFKETNSSNPLRVMTPLATASLPLLSKLTILGALHTLEEGDIKSLSAFPQLRSVSITKTDVKESDWDWFVRSNVLSRLEELATSDVEFISSIQNTLDLSTAAWPLMRKLTIYNDSLVDILQLAPQFPNITMLLLDRVKTWADGPQPGQQTHQAILNAAVNERAWPDLTTLSFIGWGHDYHGDLPVLERAWPKASIHRR